MSAPQSTIIISHVGGLDNRYQNTRHWDSLMEQIEYLTVSCRKAIYTDYTYLRRTWSIKVNATMEQADRDGWNYLSFRNSDDGKWFYYFINHYEYINDRCIELFLEMDVMQTYFWDMELLHSFVEREHTLTDNVGEHLVPEGLECGDLEVLKEFELDLELCILVLTSFDPNESNSTTRVNSFGYALDGVFSGLGLYAVKFDDWYQLETKIDKFDQWGYTDGIISMWMYPRELVRPFEGDHDWDGPYLFHKVAGINKGVEKSFDISELVEEWQSEKVPNKLFTAPHFLIYVTNNVGQSAVYNYEYFGTGGVSDFKLELFGCLSAEGSLKIAPCNYKGLSVAYDEGIYAGNFPTCAWDSDVYKLWFAQNRNTVTFNDNVSKMQIVGGVATAGVGLLAGIGGLITGIPALGAGSKITGGVTQAIGGLREIKRQQAQLKDLQVQPSQSKGNYSSSVNVANGRNTFTVQIKGVNKHYRDRITDFLNIYGYEVNTVKVPETHNRKYYTFVKTIGCNVGGNVPHDCAVKIGSIFDTGITFWRPNISVGDYSKAKQNTCLFGGD